MSLTESMSKTKKYSYLFSDFPWTVPPILLTTTSKYFTSHYFVYLLNDLKNINPISISFIINPKLFYPTHSGYSIRYKDDKLKPNQLLKGSCQMLLMIMS